jgi:hypothetical protein
MNELDNVNMLKPTGFRVVINTTECAHLQYFCTKVNLPSLTLPGVSVGFRQSKASFTGDTIQFAPLRLEFIVDEDLENYMEIARWIFANAFEEGPRERDITLSILSNRNTSNRQIRFHSASPSSLGEIAFSTGGIDIPRITCSVEFNYTRFELL